MCLVFSPGDCSLLDTLKGENHNLPSTSMNTWALISVLKIPGATTKHYSKMEIITAYRWKVETLFETARTLVGLTARFSLEALS